jgi:hypothetical protein
LFLEDEYVIAETYQKKALDHGGDKYPDYLERYGDILSKLNRGEDAVKYWKMALELPEHGPRLADKISAGKYIE